MRPPRRAGFEVRVSGVARAVLPASAPSPARRPMPRASVPRSRVRVALYLVSFTAWVCLFYYGFPYYRLGLAERLHAPAHAALRPNGGLGLLYGYVGTGFILLLLLYSVRKRVPWLRRVGLLNRWLNAHIFCGIAGPAMITLHSSFKITGAIAIGYWAMVCVMLSGFVGYYLLRQVGGALSVADQDSETLTLELEELDRELTERHGFAVSDLQSLRRRSGADRAEGMSLLGSLFYLLGQDLLRMVGALGLARQPGAVRHLGRAEARRVRSLTRRRLLLERRRAFLRQTSALFHYWHAIHKPFTIVLFLMMGVHIGVAIWLGYALPQG